MSKNTSDNQTYRTAQLTAEKIFRFKKRFHKSQARLPIEEKIRMVVELQKIIFEIKKGNPFLRNKVIWKI